MAVIEKNPPTAVLNCGHIKKPDAANYLFLQ